MQSRQRRRGQARRIPRRGCEPLELRRAVDGAARADGARSHARSRKRRTCNRRRACGRVRALQRRPHLRDRRGIARRLAAVARRRGRTRCRARERVRADRRGGYPARSRRRCRSFTARPTTTIKPTSTCSPTSCSPRPATSGTRSRTGRGRARRAGTTCSIGAEATYLGDRVRGARTHRRAALVERAHARAIHRGGTGGPDRDRGRRAARRPTRTPRRRSRSRSGRGPGSRPIDTPVAVVDDLAAQGLRRAAATTGSCSLRAAGSSPPTSARWPPRCSAACWHSVVLSANE